MSLQSYIQGKTQTLITRLGTPVKIVKTSGVNIGKTKSTYGVLDEVTTEDLQNSFIAMSDKVIYLPGPLGMIVDEGDLVTLVKSKNVYTVIKVTDYNIDDVTSNTMAVKLFLRP